MENWIPLGLAIAFGLIAIHSFATYPISLWFLRLLTSRTKPAPTRQRFPSLAICVSAYNESAGIRDKLVNLCEIIKSYPGDASAHVYDDCSTDATSEILSEFENRLTIIRGESRGGKSHGMNTLLASIDEDLVVFTDANVRIAKDALSIFASYFENENVGCVCGSLEYFDAASGATAQTSSLYWRFEEWTKQLESDTGSVIGADGSLFAIRRHLFGDVPHDIMDDFYTSLSVLCDGYEVKRAGDAKAFERAAQKSSEEFSRKKRIACRAFNCFRFLWPRLVKTGPLNLYKLISHKFLRWTAFGWLMLSFFFMEWFLMRQIGPDVAMILTAATILFVVIGYWSQLPVVKQLIEVILSLAGAGIGVLQSLRGFRYQTWEPAATARQQSSDVVGV